jgi:hypothetical protein
MAVTATPIFIQAPRAAQVIVSAANTNRDGTGTLATVWTAGVNGSRIDHVDVQAVGTTTAGVIRLYIHDGAAAMLWRELMVQAGIPSTTISVWSAAVDYSQPQNILVLQSGYSLRASTHNAEAFRAIAFGGDY